MSEAEQATSEVLRARSADIAAWASRARPGAKEAFELRLGRLVGHGVLRESGQYVPMFGCRVVLRRVVQNDRIYFVLTSYPVP